MDNNIIQPIKISLDFYNNERKAIRAKQYDKKSRYVNITCTEKGVPVVLTASNMSCYIKMSTPDKRAIYNNGVIQSDGSILFELTETMLAQPGKGELEIDIVYSSTADGDDDALLSSMNLDVIIEKSVYSNDTIIATDEFNALTELITKEQSRSDSLNALEDKVEKAEEIRVSNETERCNSEEKRKVSEEKRETDTKAAIDKTNEIILSATGALETVKQKAEEVETNATNAAKSESNAKASEQAATKSQETATEKADSALEYATKAQSYAVGGTGSREGEDSDNAKYYYEQSRDISEGLKGGLQPHGTVAFLNLPSLSDVETGWMYNISDEFTTTNDFKEGEGNVVPAGANIYKTSDGKWDVLAGTPVTGVKGAKEASYRRGNVNITAENVGAVPTDGDTAENTIAFTSSDVADGSASAWTSVSKLSSGEKHASLFAKVSQMFKNVRYLYKMLGSTDISSIGGGTVTGAICDVNSKLLKSASANGWLSDALNVSIVNSDADVNKPHLVGGNMASANQPSDLSWGIREVFLSSANHLIVKISGIATDGTSAIWTRAYTEEWEAGWSREITSRTIGKQSVKSAEVTISNDLYAYDGTTEAWGKQTTYNDKNGVRVGYINRRYLGNGTVDLYIGADKGKVIINNGYATYANSAGNVSKLTASEDSIYGYNNRMCFSYKENNGYQYFDILDLGNTVKAFSGLCNGNGNTDKCYGGTKAKLWTDGEGGNLLLISPNGQQWELDAYSNTRLRIFTYGSSTNGNKVVEFSFMEDGTFEATKLSSSYVKLYSNNRIEANDQDINIICPGKNSSTGYINTRVSTALQVRDTSNSTWRPINASAFNVNSSRRYKKNILDMSDDEARQILKYRVVDYDYINEDNGTGCQGMIAEEVAEINEYPVYRNPDGTVEGLDYSKFVPQLIKMVQIQQTQIEELKETVNILSKKITN